VQAVNAQDEVRSGLEGVIAFATEIAEPDRDGGALRYRGVDIEELVGSVPYERVWGLLVDGAFEPGLALAERIELPLRTGDVRVDVAARLVTRGDAAVEMTATELDVLLCLIEARGAALSREAIFSRVWGPNHHGTPRTIDNFVQQLRAKLEIDPQKPKHVQTVRGIGYRFDG